MTSDDALRRHDLASEPLDLDLAAAAEAMPVDLDASQDRRAVTLVRQSGLHVLLLHLRAGATLAEHAAPSAVTIQVVSGHVRVEAHERTFDAAAGRVLAFDARVPHSVDAVEPSTLLLTLATEHG